MPRLVLGVVLAAVPVALAATLWELGRERDRRGEVVRARATARFELVGQEACEQDPASYPERPFGAGSFDDWLSDEPALPSLPREAHVRYFVHDSRLHPFRADAPPISRRAARAFRSGSESFTWVPRGRGARIERTLIRTPWSSRTCAAILVEHPAPVRGALLSRVVPALLVTFSVLFAVAIVAGPVVVRIRRLIAAVNGGGAHDLARDGDDELADLADAFRAREATIASQIEALSNREAALTEHLAATSHDVLLPITVLQGHLVELESTLAKGEFPDASIVRGALEETHYVAALVRDLNAEARLRTGLVVLDAEVDLVTLVDRCVARHRPIASRSSVSVDAATPDAPLVVRGDPTLLEQMISNLVHNSVRYVQTGGHVAIILARTPTGFRLEVKDDGPGVAEDVLAQLGTRGFRTDEARTRRPEGMGLGLHIVREVAAMHAMTITFERGDPKGLTVRIEGSAQTA